MHSLKFSFLFFQILAPSFPFPREEPRIQEAGYSSIPGPLFFLFQLPNFYASLCENNSASINYFNLILDPDYFMQ